MQLQKARIWEEGYNMKDERLQYVSAISGFLALHGEFWKFCQF